MMHHLRSTWWSISSAAKPPEQTVRSGGAEETEQAKMMITLNPMSGVSGEYETPHLTQESERPRAQDTEKLSHGIGIDVAESNDKIVIKAGKEEINTKPRNVMEIDGAS